MASLVSSLLLLVLSALAALWSGDLQAAEARSPSLSKWEQLLAAAKKEGRIVVAGPPVTELREVVLGFQRAFPDIRLEYTGMPPAQFETRVSRERQVNQYLWDVFVSGVSSTFYTIQMPWYEPLKPALVLPEVTDDSKWMGGFDAGFLDKEKKYAYTFANYVASSVNVNRDFVPDSALRKIEDLLDPRWKGKIAWIDPRMGDAGTNSVAHLKWFLGADGVKRLLVDQEPVVTQDLRQISEWLVRGRYPIAMGVSDTEIGRFQKEGLGLNIKPLPFPMQRVTAGWGGVFMLKSAPHPNAAKVFVNWLLSKEAQAEWAKRGRTNSRRLDVPAGNASVAVDPKKVDQYLNFNKQDNVVHYLEARDMAKSRLK